MTAVVFVVISMRNQTANMHFLLLFTPIHFSANRKAPTFGESPWDASGVKEIQF